MHDYCFHFQSISEHMIAYYSIDHSYIMRAHHAIFWLLHSLSGLSILTEYIYIYSLPLTDIDFRYRGDIEDIMLPVFVCTESAPGGDRRVCMCMLYAGGTLDRREKKIVCYPDWTCIWECLGCFIFMIMLVLLLDMVYFGGRLRSSRYAIRLYIGDMYHRRLFMFYGPTCDPLHVVYVIGCCSNPV